MEKLVAVDAGYVKIDKSIVVVVAGGNSHRVANALQAGLFRYVCESAVPVVAEEPVGITGIVFFKRGDRRAVRKEDIQQAVVVVIEERYSSSHGFKRIALRTDAVLQLELDLRFFDDVLKLDRSGCFCFLC